MVTGEEIASPEVISYDKRVTIGKNHFTYTFQHWYKFPNMEIIDTKYALDMHIDPGDNPNWIFNLKLNKVFIKLNSVMTATVAYKPSDANSYSLRAMIVYTSPDDMHLQVKRCANHKASSKSMGENQGSFIIFLH